MADSENVKLTDVEQEWLDMFIDTMQKMPKALTLRINSFGDGNVEVFSPEGKDFTAAQSRWIGRLQSILMSFPHTPEFWTLSNIDGFHVGKGYPSTYSGSGYGPSGAEATYSDNFSEFYLVTYPVDYGDFASNERENYDWMYLRTCIGDLKVWNVSENGKRLC
ncbi:hypothetical protein ABXZ88_003264 [Vibrio fluvialis]